MRARFCALAFAFMLTPAAAQVLPPLPEMKFTEIGARESYPGDRMLRAFFAE